MDLQFVVDTCGKNYPKLKKLKGLFSQLYEFAMKNDICNKDCSEYVDIVRYKDKNPDKRDHNKFEKAEVERLWKITDATIMVNSCIPLISDCPEPSFRLYSE